MNFPTMFIFRFEYCWWLSLISNLHSIDHQISVENILEKNRVIVFLFCRICGIHENSLERAIRWFECKHMHQWGALNVSDSFHFICSFYLGGVKLGLKNMKGLGYPLQFETAGEKSETRHRKVFSLHIFLHFDIHLFCSFFASILVNDWYSEDQAFFCQIPLLVASISYRIWHAHSFRSRFMDKNYSERPALYWILLILWHNRNQQ